MRWHHRAPMCPYTNSLADMDQRPLTRSSESLGFEKMWLDLPHGGRVPERQAFKPRLAKRFLRHIILAQAPTPGDPTLRIRVVGDAIRQCTRVNIVGRNYLDFMEEEERKARALEIVRDMFERPCGQWWVSPVHYERGFSHYWEMTAFPLVASEHGPAAILALVRPFDSLLGEHRTDGAAVRIAAAVQFEAIAVDR
jgi:hypothetical protein